MKVIIEHDDYCPASAKGKESWLRTFEKLRSQTARGYDTLESMKELASDWAELARSTDHCTCGASEEIERRKKEEHENLRMVAVQS